MLIVSGPLEAWGFIPYFLNEDSEADAVTQLSAGYAHGGGWRDFHGFTLSLAGGGKVVGEAPDDYRLSYPGDPSYKEISRINFRDETIVLFPHGWVAVVQLDGTYRVARMD